MPQGRSFSVGDIVQLQGVTVSDQTLVEFVAHLRDSGMLFQVSAVHSDDTYAVRPVHRYVDQSASFRRLGSVQNMVYQGSELRPVLCPGMIRNGVLVDSIDMVTCHVVLVDANVLGLTRLRVPLQQALNHFGCGQMVYNPLAEADMGVVDANGRFSTNHAYNVVSCAPGFIYKSGSTGSTIRVLEITGTNAIRVALSGGSAMTTEWGILSGHELIGIDREGVFVGSVPAQQEEVVSSQQIRRAQRWTSHDEVPGYPWNEVREEEAVMKYGFELECISSDYSSIGEVSRTLAKEYGFDVWCDSSTTSENTGDRWKVTMDSSVGPPEKEDEDGFIGVEIVSPVFRSFAEMEDGAKRMMKALKEMGLSYNEDCGLHYHVSHTSLSPGSSDTTLRSLVLAMALLEPHIYRTLQNRYRMSRKYCRPLPISLISALLAGGIDSNLNPTTRVTIQNVFLQGNSRIDSKYGYDRYRGCNFHALWYRGAMEFRYHEMTLDPKELCFWFEFYGAVLNAVTQTRGIDELYVKLEPLIKRLRSKRKKNAADGGDRAIHAMNVARTNERMVRMVSNVMLQDNGQIHNSSYYFNQ